MKEGVLTNHLWHVSEGETAHRQGFLQGIQRLKLKDLQRSIQALDRSITHRATAGTNPDFPWAAFSCLEGFVESSNLIFVIIWG